MGLDYMLNHKHEAFKCFQDFLAIVERQTGKKVKILRTYRGDEFLSTEFNHFCYKLGIKHELTTLGFSTIEWCGREEK